MDLKLGGKIALVTGAGGGIGTNEPCGCCGGPFVAPGLLVARRDDTSSFPRSGIGRLLLRSRVRLGRNLRGLSFAFCTRLLILRGRAACFLARLGRPDRRVRLLRLRHNRAGVAIVIARLRTPRRQPREYPGGGHRNCQTA